jgi:hypothetical protein
VAPIHAVGVYPAQLSEQPPLQPSQGNGASTAELQVAAAAVVTAGDAISRYQAIEAKRDRGLAGGYVAVTQAGSLLTLQRDRLVPGVAVSGTVRLTPSPIAGDGQSVLAALTARAAGVAPESLTASWTTTGADAAARVAGTAAKRSLSGTTPAP